MERRNQRHIISLFFAGVLVLPPLLMMILQLRQLHLRHEAMESMEEKELQTITLKTHDFIWVKKEKEILTGDRLFDVKTYTENDGLFRLTGLYDEKETAIKKILSRHHPKPQSGNIIIQLLIFGQSCAVDEIEGPCPFPVKLIEAPFLLLPYTGFSPSPQPLPPRSLIC